MKNVVQDLTSAGHEWMRAKWSAPIRKYWKVSEQMMVKYCDLAICDSVNIEKYIHECYDGKGINGRNPKTTFIAYGADLTLSKLADDNEKLVNWYKEKGLTKKDYYLVVGRFVPENSFEVMIREFMKSKSKKNFAIITNVNEKFLNELEEKLHFKSDKRIKFVGTVYDQELLKKIRENAYPCRRLLHPGLETAGGTPPYRKVRTDAPGIFKGSPPSQIEYIDTDRRIVDISCRPERTGTGTVRHYHGADESHRGRDRGIEANSTNGMGAAL